jgi:hypothetical protein
VSQTVLAMRFSRYAYLLCALAGVGFAPAAGAWQDVLISNTAPRTEEVSGAVVGAQDGNLVEVPPSQGGGFALIGMSYGFCPFVACANQTDGACGFGMGAIHVWRSASLGQESWSAPVELLPAAVRPLGIYFRPHLIWNAASSRWVLWVRWLDNAGSSLSDDNTTYLTATALQLEGPYTVAQANTTMFWPNSADDNLFVDDDGSAYLVHTARSTGTKIVVERLTADYTESAGATDPNARSALIGPGHTESPALFKVAARYYVSFGELCCYCVEGAAALVYVADAPLGPYTYLTNLRNAARAQQNFVFAAPSVMRGVLWSGNRWGSDPIHPSAPLFDDSLQFWSLLDIGSDGNITAIAWQDALNITVNV